MFVNNYKFNGQELQEELGLNLYDMDLRDYDPAIARWMGVDPVTHHSQSPYNAFDGNPVLIADPSGADGTRGDGMGGTIYTNAYGVSSSPGYNGYSSMGSNWHVGSQSIFGPIDGSSGGLFGNFYNINANNPNLSVYGKTWVPYSITPSSEAGVLDTVNLGYWVKNSADKVGLLGIYGGTFLDLLSDRAAYNATSGIVNASYTASYYTNLSKFTGSVSKYLGGAGVVLSLTSMGYKKANNISIKNSEIASTAIGTTIFAASLATSAAAATVASGVAATATVAFLAAAAPAVAVIAIGYGFCQIVSYVNTGKSMEENFFNK